MAHARAQSLVERQRRQRVDCLGVEVSGPHARSHRSDERVERRFSLAPGRRGIFIHRDEHVGPIACNLDGDVADERPGLFLEQALIRNQRAAAVEAHQRAHVLGGERAREPFGVERRCLRLSAAPPTIGKRCRRALQKLARRPHHGQLARTLALRRHRQIIVGTLQHEALAEAAPHRLMQHGRHGVEADRAEFNGAFCFERLEPGIEALFPFRTHAGADVGDPRQRAHRRQIARAHGTQKTRVARARQQRHAPAHARNEVAEIGERRVLPHIAVDQHGRPAVAVHCGVQRIEPQRELVIGHAILRPGVGANRQARLHGPHVAPQTGITSSCAGRAESARAALSVTTTGSPHIR